MSNLAPVEIMNLSQIVISSKIKHIDIGRQGFSLFCIIL